jgi:hypothetical protein
LCWLGQKVGRLIRQDIQLGHTRWCDLLYWNILYALSWVLGGAILYFLVRALLPVPWSLLPRLVWAWAVSGLIGFVRFLIPFLLAARELSLAVIMAPFVPLPLAIVAAALSRLCLIAGDLLGILLSWLIR